MIPQIREINFPEYATLHEATASFAVMGERTITTQVRIDGDIVPEFEGWELEFKGERFVLPVKEPQAQKNNTTRNSLVDLTFYSWPIYQMKRFFFFETTTTATGTVMADKYQASVNLNLVNFVALFNRVLDYYFDGKIVADLAEGSYGTAVSAIQLNYSYIWDVLQDFYSIFNVRWTIAYDEENDVYAIKIGYAPNVIEEHEFEYGFQGGLLHFERQLQDDNIKNILLGRGGEKNLPYRYFKKQDPNNPDWAADPDGIKELENIYFDRIRDLNFRNYIQGWKTNPNRILDTGDVVEEYDESRGARDWAYKKGHEDELFDPVEYVKDQASIDKYGERWGALDDNDDIYPTIQGIIRPGLGRVDEVVDVSPIITDDVQESMEAAAEIVSVEGVMSQVGTVPALGYIVKQIRGSNFTVPTGQTANIQNNGWFAINESDLAPFLSVNTDLSRVRIFDASTDTEVSSADQGLSAGTYYYVIDITVQNASASTLNNVTYGVNGLDLVISDSSAESWKPTFDIWIKNIFESTQQPEETDEDYALRVWREILGDRLGNEAKVVFSDGFMSISQDYEFVIASYPTVDRSKVFGEYRSEWKLTLYKSAAEYEVSGLYIPNNTSGGKPVAGDHFFFVGIDMPHMYVTLAEERVTQYKTLALEQMAEVNPTWVIHLDKIRADQVNADSQRFFDQISPGVEMHVKDKRFTKDEILRLFANTITYNWHEPTDDNPYLLPDVEIVVSDRIVVEKSTVDKIQGDLDVLKATYAKMSDMESVIQQVASPMFLRKTGEQDTSLSPTRFASTVTSRDFRQGGFGGRGWGLYRDNSNKYQKSPDANSSIEPTRGARMLRAATRGASPELEEKATDAVLEIDKLVVRKEMQVNSLVVNQIAYIGGKQVNSAAAMECVQVVETDDSYICYFDQKQGSVKNLFTVGDIAMGQIFDPNNMTLRYYKMIVTATDVDNITISKAGRAGSSAPQKGDVIVQYGNLYDESRQYVIVRDVIGGGYERMLSDLNSVDATGTEYYFAGCDMSSDGVPTALFSSEPEPLYDSNGEPLMSTEYARARFFVGGDDSHMEFKQADRRLYLKGTIVQSPSGDEFPVVCFRGEYDVTGQTLYYYGDEVTYQGATYLYINRVPSNAVPTDTTYWKVRAQAGASAKSVEIVASSLFFTFDNSSSITPTGDQSIILTCVTQNIPGATYAWSYWSGSIWVPMSQITSSVTIPYNFTGFIDKVAKIKVVVNGDDNLYDEVSLYKVTGGKDGENVLVVDIDNEMEGIELNSSGRVKSATTFQTVGTIHYGAEAQAITAAAISGLPSGCTYTVSYNSGSTEATFSISIPANTALDASQSVSIDLTSAKGSGSTSFTILGLKEGTPRYSILPSTKVISRDKDNNCDPTGVSCQVMKQTADGYVNGLADGTLRYYLDSSSTARTYSSGQTILVGDGTGKFHDKVRFEFVVSGTVLDKETIFVVDDGEESISAFLTNNNKNFPAGETYAIASSDSFTAVVFRGMTLLEYDGEDFYIGTIYNKNGGSASSPNIPSGMTVTLDSSASSPTFGTVTVSVTDQFSIQSGTLIVPVIVSGYGTVNLEYNWALALAGTPAKAVKIVASSLYFTYDNSESTTPTGDQSIVLTCVSQNISNPSYVWSYWNGSAWTTISGQSNSTLTVAHNSSWFNSGKVAKIKVVVDNNNLLYDEISIYKVIGGKNGENVLIVDIDNEMDSVELSSSGRAKSATTIQTTAQIHYGIDAQAITASSLSGLPSGCSYTRSYNTGSTAVTFTITIPANTSLDSSQNIGVSLTCAKGSGITSFTILGIKDGQPRYSILPSTKVISRDKDNVCDPTGVSCQVMKQTADGYVDGLADGTLRYYLDTSSTARTYTAGQTVLVGDGSGKFHDKVRFEFVVNSTVLDKETIFVVDDGEESISIFLTNNNRNFAAGDTYAVPASDTFTAIAFRGKTMLEYDGEDFYFGTVYNKDGGSAGTPNIPTGMTVTVDRDSQSSTFGTITVAVDGTFSTRQGTLIIPVVVSGYGTVNLEYSWSLALSGRGEKGDVGPTIRGPRQWVATEGYVNDNQYIDIVYYDPTNSGKGLYYQRKKENSGVAYNTPPDQDTTHWVESDKFAFVAADLILAPNGKINNLVVDQVKTTHRDPTTQQEIDDFNPITIINNQITIKNEDGDDKVKITSGELPSGHGGASYYSMSGITIDMDEPSGVVEQQLGTISVTAENNIVQIPCILMTLQYLSPNTNPGDVSADVYLKVGEDVLFSISAFGAATGYTNTFYYRSQSEYASPGLFEKTLPVGTHKIMLVVNYTVTSELGGGEASLVFSPKYTSNLQISYPAIFTMIASNGAQFRYGQDGIRTDSDGARVIQGGGEYNILGGDTLNPTGANAIPAPKRIAVCREYPSASEMEDDVLYIKVSSS